MKNHKEKWEEEISSDGRIYYYNSRTGTSQWENPKNESIPSKYFWKSYKDSNGNIFYYNKKTKESSWKKPAEYTEDIIKQQELEFKRENFFKMMSSSVPRELNPIQYPTPALHTIKETSVRFDTDPRLIDVNEKQRERFIDEWIILERKRRVELEMKMVENAKERLKEKMYELVQSGKFTIDTKWDEMIKYFQRNKDWRILLNYDRLKVFTDVKKAVQNDYVLTFNEEREQRLKVEAIRRIKFLKAIEPIINEIKLPITNLTYKTAIEKASKLPEFNEMNLNINGSSAIDLIYDEIEDKFSYLEEKVGSFTKDDLIYQKFLENHNNELVGLSEEESKYIYEDMKNVYIVEEVITKKEEKTKHNNLIRLLRLTPSLVNCTSFEAAKTIISRAHEFKEVGDEEQQKQIFNEFVEWSKDRNCEPGEIIKGDDDWEDIGPMVENEIRKRQFEYNEIN